VIFLIFVAAFVTVACVVLPLAVLAIFAIASDAETGVSARRSRVGSGTTAVDDRRLVTGKGEEVEAPFDRHSALVDRKSSMPSRRTRTVVT
jgi:hypothetical protein